MGGKDQQSLWQFKLRGCKCNSSIWIKFCWLETCSRNHVQRLWFSLLHLSPFYENHASFWSCSQGFVICQIKAHGSRRLWRAVRLSRICCIVLSPHHYELQQALPCNNGSPWGWSPPIRAGGQRIAHMDLISAQWLRWISSFWTVLIPSLISSERRKPSPSTFYFPLNSAKTCKILAATACGWFLFGYQWSSA